MSVLLVAAFYRCLQDQVV